MMIKPNVHDDEEGGIIHMLYGQSPQDIPTDILSGGSVGMSVGMSVGCLWGCLGEIDHTKYL